MQNPTGVRVDLAPIVFVGRAGPSSPSMTDLAIVTLASLFAGFIDAIVGGGGLILVPALFSVFPSAAPATLFGTNKGASIWGTAWATGQFARQVNFEWGALGPATAAASQYGASAPRNPLRSRSAGGRNIRGKIPAGPPWKSCS